MATSNQRSRNERYYDDDDNRSRGSQSRQRDDEGRFMSDHDDGYRTSRSSRDDRDRTTDYRDRGYDDIRPRSNQSRSNQSQWRERDDEGRFISEDDDRGSRLSSSRSNQSRDRDDREYSSYGRSNSYQDDYRSSPRAMTGMKGPATGRPVSVMTRGAS